MKIRFYERLYFRFFCVFGLAFSVLVLLIGLVFMQLYSRNVIAQFSNQLEEDAGEIADKVEDYVIAGQFSGYLDYIDAAQSLLESQMVDIWIMSYSKAEQKLKKKYRNIGIKFSELSPGMQKIMQYVYKEDGTFCNQGFDEIYETELIRAGAPIHDAGGNVIGGVLLNAVAESRMLIIQSGKSVIIFCMIFTWIISMILATIFSKTLSGPISQIRRTALKLADGEYATKTGLRPRGEIGQLSETMNVLSERLIENERVRDEIEQTRLDFFANVSHELRTPITVIRGYTETLADGYVTEQDKVEHTYQRMLKECRGMERLVGDLLLISKMQNPDFEIEKELISIVQVFEDVSRSARVLSESKNIKINFHANDDYCFMMGDYDRLRQMFMIIIDNAIKFTKDNSSVDIEVEKSDRLNIKIKDYGVGIETDALPYIFDKFYRSKLQMNEQGSGLGLVIAKQIALRHGGDIEVQSQIGEGSCFSFSFENAEAPEDL